MVVVLPNKKKTFQIVPKGGGGMVSLCWPMDYKCVITGISIEYFARKKRERNKEKEVQQDGALTHGRVV